MIKGGVILAYLRVRGYFNANVEVFILLTFFDYVIFVD